MYLALDRTHVYWTNNANDTGSVARRAKASGDVEVLVAGQANPGFLAVDETTVYFTTFGDGAVKRVPKSGGDEDVVATGQPGASGIAVDADSIYWCNFGDGAVRRADKLTGTSTELAVVEGGPVTLAVDDERVYVVTNALYTGQVLAIPKG